MSDDAGVPSRRLHRVEQDPIAHAWREIQSSSRQRRIMLVVPGRLFRNGIGRVLQGPDRIIVGDCECLDEVETALEAQPDPDLFVVGVAAPENAAAAFVRIRSLRAKMPGARWIILSRSVDLSYLRDAIHSGVDGMLLEDSPGEALQLLAELVMLGHSFVPAELAKALAGELPSAGISAVMPDVTSPARLVEPPPAATVHPETALPDTRRWQVSLSERERQILHCLIAGHPNKLIARELRIAEATVKVHVKALLRKMQVTNRTQAAISALQFLRSTDGAGRAHRAADGASSVDEADRTAPPRDKMNALMRVGRLEPRPFAIDRPVPDTGRVLLQ